MALNVIQKIAKICDSVTKKEKRPFTTAIILAAGKSTRMQNDEISKQMLEIDGVPVVVRSMLAFEGSDYVHEIIVVGTKDELSVYKDFKRIYNITKLKTAVEGGDCRAKSAEHGFLRISPKAKFVAIHDAARCLITTKDIDRTIKEAQRYGAAIAAKKATDTVKIADKFGFVKETPERSLSWHAQTPQVFKKTIYDISLAKTDKLDDKITDDAMMVERAGFHIKLVECKSENIKITKPEDLAVAADILTKQYQESISEEATEESA